MVKNMACIIIMAKNCDSHKIHSKITMKSWYQHSTTISDHGSKAPMLTCSIAFSYCLHFGQKNKQQ